MDIAEKQVCSGSTGGAAEESMVQIFCGSIADLTDTRLIGDSVLGGEELMEELEQKGSLLTTESLCSCQCPSGRPVLLWHKLLHPDRKEYLWGSSSTRLHESSVFK